MDKIKIIDVSDEEYEQMKSFDYDEEINNKNGEKNESTN